MSVLKLSKVLKERELKYGIINLNFHLEIAMKRYGGYEGEERREKGERKT